MHKYFVRNTVILVLLVLALIGLQVIRTPHVLQQSRTPSLVPTQKPQVVPHFSYKGQEDVDALTLLKEQTAVEAEASGLVSAINGRKADPMKHEYWAFYVNGKLADVGPADYITKDSDTIEWKIETY